MSTIVAAFLGGIIFAVCGAGVGIWLACRGVVELPDECPRCGGTGLDPAEDAAEPPSEVPEDLESMK